MAQKLNNSLILNKYFLSLLGMKKVEELQETFSGVSEGFTENGESFLILEMKLLGNKILFTNEEITKYDNNIKNYINHIKKHRDIGFNLMYFQYLALLFTEYYLDHLFSDKTQFLQDLNTFVNKENENIKKETDKYKLFQEQDLGKLAYYQATGSGKTLIGHINYLQYLHYFQEHNNKKLDMIIMITPNESLTRQHIEEFRKSGIQAERLVVGTGLFQGTYTNTIQIIEITKLKENKTGNGESIAVESFDGKKLVLIDEGHRGTTGEQWKKIRDIIGKDSFTYEYSATFGQAIRKDKELIEEYGKAIIFDYSYRYFHSDGYGKDYNILNLKENIEEDQQFTFMVGNLLTFIEQQIFFKQKPDIIKKYNIEAPLWVFVGNSVRNSGTKDTSDIMEVIKFLSELIGNKKRTIDTIKNILNEETLLKNEEGLDLFQSRLKYLRNYSKDPATIYQKIQQDFFHTTGNGKLYVVDMKNTQGELGLKVGQNDYFGVVNVGDIKGLVKMAEKEDNIIVDTDNFNQSLFNSINNENSKIQVLIGSRKFSEGWNSYRVSCMGLLNMGSGEGSQIIQLFGRGVRLKGIKNCLKRSEKVNSGADTTFFMKNTLETLYIFGLRANYMEKFRDYLEQEGIDTTEYKEVSFPVFTDTDMLNHKLKVPRIKEGLIYKEKIELKYHGRIKDIVLDISTKIGELSSLSKETSGGIVKGDTQKLDSKLFGLYDWEYIYFIIQQFHKEKKYDNILISNKVLEEIIENEEWYEIEGYTKQQNIKKKVKKEQEMAIILLKKYITKFYTYHQQEWESDKMEYKTLESTDKNLIKEYILKIPKEEKKLIKEIETMKKDITGLNTILAKTGYDLFDKYTINFDKHLYKPLFIKEQYKEGRNTKENPILSTPEGLNKGETKFIEKLKDFLTNNMYKELWENKSFYLLRNLKKAEGGVSFFQANNFSPDFILWVVEGETQHIVFLDPKGIRELGGQIDNPKIQLHTTIKDKEKLLGNNKIKLHSFILSVTKFTKIEKHWNEEKEQFIKNGVLFMEDKVFIRDLLKKIK